MCQRRITLPKDCTKSLKPAHKLADFQISQVFSLSLIDEHGSHAVAGYTSRRSTVTKRELNWTGAEAHPGGTGSPAQKLKRCFLPDFYPFSHHHHNMHFFKGVTFWERSNIHIYIYRK